MPTKHTNTQYASYDETEYKMQWEVEESRVESCLIEQKVNAACVVHVFMCGLLIYATAD